jgi:hypothetical protein
MWKHFTSSLWMNTTNFIFRLLHIHNLLTLVVLTPPRLPYTPSADYVSSSANYTNFSTNYANKSNDCVNIYVDSADTHDRSSLDLCIPNPSLMYLFFTNLLVIIDQKSILCWLQDLPSIIHLLYFAFVVSIFHNLHLPPPYQNSPPELYLHSVPNILASVVLFSKLQIPCTCKVELIHID